jgi:O-antigen/teichoic acid export membrane protein
MSILSGIMGRMGAFLALVRFRPFDSTTAEGWARERHRRVVLTAMASVAARSVSVVSALITVPLTLHYLGVDRYGLWMAISSVIALMSFTDFGLGNGLINAVAKAHGREDRDMAAHAVSSAFYLLLAIAVGLACVFALAYPWVPWARVFNVRTPEAMADAGPAMAIFAGWFLIGLPLSVVSRIQAGYQEGFHNSFWQAIGNTAGLVCLLVAIAREASLPWLVCLMAGLPVVATFANGICLFWVRRPWLRPSLQAMTLAASRSILRTGSLFFVLQIAAVVTFASDALIIAQLFGSSTVPEYAVPMRLFSLAPMMLSMMLSPLWPAYGESAARGDVVWIRKTLLRSLRLALLVTGVPCLLLMIFGHALLNFWVGPALQVSSLLLVGMGIWTVMSGAGESVAMFLNGTNSIRFQAVTATLTCCAALTAKIAFGRWLGLPGVVFGTVLAYGVCTALPMMFFIPGALARLAERADPRVGAGI